MDFIRVRIDSRRFDLLLEIGGWDDLLRLKISFKGRYIGFNLSVYSFVIYNKRWEWKVMRKDRYCIEPKDKTFGKGYNYEDFEWVTERRWFFQFPGWGLFDRSKYKVGMI